eukprot:TRINITY_DN54313_c0_g1_i1.p1 TRINITY_DN54313_c0_g1~~TRINITY_DN54313_c0_g1_i1.p1  ORF type:complete len:137 (+),score=35.16 TRINITY_DN54313_c0_g1_i1:96-506(+)
MAALAAARNTLQRARPAVRFCASESSGSTRPRIMLATMDRIPGKEVKEYKGLVIGSTVRTKDMSKDITSAVRAIFGGELPHYTQLMSDTREEAISRLEDQAAELGANAVVSLRLTSSNIAANASEVMAFGTAVVVE